MLLSCVVVLVYWTAPMFLPPFSHSHINSFMLIHCIRPILYSIAGNSILLLFTQCTHSLNFFNTFV